MDMMTLALKAMGVDGETIMAQAMAVAEGFGRMQSQLTRIEANQHAIMGHLGMDIPEPDAETLLLIAVKSREHIAQIETLRLA